jgi:GntR family transcriptional regulator
MGNIDDILNIKIDSESARPVYEQIKQGIQIAILSDKLKTEDKLPAIRGLAKKLRVNPNTVVKVYYQLDVEGFIYSKPGLGYFVKCDRESKKKTKGDIFKEITEDYVASVSKLGFSLEDMKTEIDKMKNDV